jgi:FO synthase
MQESAALDLARRGLSFGCSEALLTLGEKPEELYQFYNGMLEDLGFRSTNTYVAHLSRRIFEETGLYPHVNVGVMDEEDFELLEPVALSMGLMLENASERFLGPKMPHAKSPGKAPKERLRTLERAGELGIAFTTGILVGIGETLEERLEALLAIQDIQARFGHIQEVIIQNFLPKPRTPMAKARPPSHEEMVLTIALARVVLGGAMNIQAPPNLALGPLEGYLRAGINDLGGISPLTQDFINPEAPWPHIESLGHTLAKGGFSLKPRLPLYPEFFSKAFVRPLFMASLSMDENGAQEYRKKVIGAYPSL